MTAPLSSLADPQEGHSMTAPDISAQIAEIAADPNAYVAETRRRARASAAPLSSLADHADERFTEAQRAKVAEFESAPEPPEIVVERVARALVVERVARAMWDEDGGDVRWVALAPDSYLRARYRRLAIAAVAALHGKP